MKRSDIDVLLVVMSNKIPKENVALAHAKFCLHEINYVGWLYSLVGVDIRSWNTRS